MNRKYFLMFMFLTIGLVYAENVYLFNFNYNDGEVKLINIDSLEGYVPTVKEGGYSFVVLSKNDDILNKFNFELPKELEIVPTKEKEGKHIELKNFNFTIASNYNKKFSKLRIEKNNEILFEENVEKYNLKYEEINWLFYYVLFVLIIIVGYLAYKVKKA